MEHIRELINKSKKWKFKRRIFYDNKLYGSVNGGVLIWTEKENNIFLYEESGILNLPDCTSKFAQTFHFIFNGNQYKVYRNNGILFYESNANSKVTYISDNDLTTEIEVKYINNIITMKVEAKGTNKFNTIITNYYLN